MIYWLCINLLFAEVVLQVIYSPVSPFPVPTALALGNFDGLHLAHRRLICDTVAFAKTHGLCPAVFSFSPPAGVEKPLFTESEKIAAIETLGVEALFLYRFKELHTLSPERFVSEILIEHLSAVAVFCGFDFRFGALRGGDAALLKTLLEKRGKSLFVLEPQYMDGVLISSSAVRARCESGDFEGAERLLGHALPTCEKT